MTGPAAEQRAHQRLPLEVPVRIADGRSRVDGTIRLDMRDLSEGGAFLRSQLLFEVGEEMVVEFRLPSESPAGTTVRALARVAHVVQSPSLAVAGMGVAFTDVPAWDREAMRDFLARGGAPASGGPR